MAKLDIIFVGGIGYLGFNLTSTVGKGGANQTGDVMLIQAVFAFLSRNHEPRQAERWAQIPAPIVDGNPRTGIIEAVLQYQKLFNTDAIGFGEQESVMSGRNALAYPSFYKGGYNGPNALAQVDGLIHPANYRRRNLSALWGTALMTITKLYADVSQIDGGMDRLQMESPQLRPHLLDGT